MGMREVEAVFPHARYANKCTLADKSCYSVEIDDSDKDRARVLVRYLVPLVFPLDVILGSDTFPVHSLKGEIRQIATIH